MFEQGITVDRDDVVAALATAQTQAVLGTAVNWREATVQLHWRPEQSLLQVELTVGFPCATVQRDVESALEGHLKRECQGMNNLPDGYDVTVCLKQDITAAQPLSAAPSIPNIKHIIAVASGKGGVGKSTTAVNIAFALQQEGARVGLLDADIYGPSLQMMLGLAEDVRPELLGGQSWRPITAHGIEAMSMAFLVTERTPMLWRGPMVSGALIQLLSNTQWSELDYLIVDMPPGTGDIQLTCVQKVPVTGAVIVTTPQDIALLDAKKGVEMFKKVGVPILGIAENMAVHRCSNCGHEEHLFGEGGGERIAALYGTSLLGSLPLDMSIRQQADEGLPVVASDPEGAVAERYRAIARAATASLWSQLTSYKVPEIEILND